MEIKNILYKILNYVLCELIHGPRSGCEGAEGPLINAPWKSPFGREAARFATGGREMKFLRPWPQKLAHLRSVEVILGREAAPKIFCQFGHFWRPMGPI